MKLSIELSDDEFIAFTKIFNPVTDIVPPASKVPAASPPPALSLNPLAYFPGFGIDLMYIGEDARFDRHKVYQGSKTDWEDQMITDIHIMGVGWVLKKFLTPTTG